MQVLGGRSWGLRAPDQRVRGNAPGAARRRLSKRNRVLRARRPRRTKPGAVPDDGKRRERLPGDARCHRPGRPLRALRGFSGQGGRRGGPGRREDGAQQGHRRACARRPRPRSGRWIHRAVSRLVGGAVDWLVPAADAAVKAYLADPRSNRDSVRKLSAVWAQRPDIIKLIDERNGLRQKSYDLAQAPGSRSETSAKVAAYRASDRGPRGEDRRPDRALQSGDGRNRSEQRVARPTASLATIPEPRRVERLARSSRADRRSLLKIYTRATLTAAFRCPCLLGLQRSPKMRARRWHESARFEAAFGRRDSRRDARGWERLAGNRAGAPSGLGARLHLRNRRRPCIVPRMQSFAGRAPAFGDSRGGRCPLR